MARLEIDDREPLSYPVAHALSVLHVEAEAPYELDQWDWYNSARVATADADYILQTLCRLETGALDFYATSDTARRKTRRNIIRRPMHLQDYVDDDQGWGERFTEVADCATPRRPDIMQARQRLYERFGYEGVGIGNMPVESDTIPHSNAKVQHIGGFTGRGTMRIVAQDEGGSCCSPRKTWWRKCCCGGDPRTR